MISRSLRMRPIKQTRVLTGIDIPSNTHAYLQQLVVASHIISEHENLLITRRRNLATAADAGEKGKKQGYWWNPESDQFVKERVDAQNQIRFLELKIKDYELLSKKLHNWDDIHEVLVPDPNTTSSGLYDEDAFIKEKGLLLETLKRLNKDPAYYTKPRKVDEKNNASNNQTVLSAAATDDIKVGLEIEDVRKVQRELEKELAQAKEKYNVLINDPKGYLNLEKITRLVLGGVGFTLIGMYVLFRR